MPSWDPLTSVLALSVLVTGIATIVYTYLGGMTAVIWTDGLQLVIYVAGAIVAAVVLVGSIDGGWSRVVSTGLAAGKFRVFDFSASLTKSYTFAAGLVGGAFLTTATHGTDQLMVQRYLCSRSANDARLALLGSGLIILAQFVLFLLIGEMLYVFYTRQSPSEAAAFVVAGRTQTDRVFPAFIASHLPVGVAGLVIAAILAAAMSTLSSSLNSSSATAIADFYMPLTRGVRSNAHYLAMSRLMTVVWGALQIVVAFVAIKLSSRVVDEVLGIASFTNGLILGVFLLGTFTRRVRERGAIAGMVFGGTVMLMVRLLTSISWQWYVLVGSLVTVGAGLCVSVLIGEAPDDGLRTEAR
jgi:SSS family transporter